VPQEQGSDMHPLPVPAVKQYCAPDRHGTVMVGPPLPPPIKQLKGGPLEGDPSQARGAPSRGRDTAPSLAPPPSPPDEEPSGATVPSPLPLPAVASTMAPSSVEPSGPPSPVGGPACPPPQATIATNKKRPTGRSTTLLLVPPGTSVAARVGTWRISCETERVPGAAQAVPVLGSGGRARNTRRISSEPDDAIATGSRERRQVPNEPCR
jgi:hypothetical protein